MTKVLLTTTSFQDTPGKHHDFLEEQGWEILKARGPLPETEMLNLVEGIDAMICGDDAITRAVIEKGLPTLKCISKYGIGIDKIEVEAATDLGLPVCNTPGVNHVTVSEHVFALALGLSKNLVQSVNSVRQGEWKRPIGHEIAGKQLGIIGLGRIGKEVVKRAKAFGMEVCAYDIYWDEVFARENGILRNESVEELLTSSDIISLHTNLTPETRHLINTARLELCKEGAIIINCARGELVDTGAIVSALESEAIGGYGADVLDEEPPPPDHPLLRAPNCIITPHIGSRTYESVVRQASAAIENLLRVLRGEAPLSQVNTKKDN